MPCADLNFCISRVRCMAVVLHPQHEQSFERSILERLPESVSIRVLAVVGAFELTRYALQKRIS